MYRYWLILLPSPTKIRYLLITVVISLSVACGVMSLPVKSDVSPKPPPESHQNAQEAPGTKFDGILTRSTAETVYCVTATKSLNLRVAPSTSAAADPDGLLHGVRVSVLGTGAGWLKVETEDGRSGWVKSEYIGGCDG